MNEKYNPTYVGPDEIIDEWNVSRATAYSIIRRLNDALKKAEPIAIIIPGKVNRTWYNRAKLNNHAQDA